MVCTHDRAHTATHSLCSIPLRSHSNTHHYLPPSPPCVSISGHFHFCFFFFFFFCYLSGAVSIPSLSKVLRAETRWFCTVHCVHVSRCVHMCKDGRSSRPQILTQFVFKELFFLSSTLESFPHVSLYGCVYLSCLSIAQQLRLLLNA